MHVELLQDMINVLSYAIGSKGPTVEELIEILNYEFADDPSYPTGPEPVSEYPEEVKSAFGGANDGEMYDDYLRYLSGSAQRSSLDKQMENRMRITESKLRRILRKVIVETFSDSQSTSRGSNLGKLPVGIDPSRSTVSASASDKVLKAIDQMAKEEGMSRKEIGPLKTAINKLTDCMTRKVPHEQCAQMLQDAGLDIALQEVGYILHDVAGEGELSAYALQVDEIIMDGLEY